MKWVEKIDDLYSFFGYVAACAPDRFKRHEFLSDADQMNLDKAFVEMRYGISLLDPRVGTPEKLIQLNAMLDESRAAYERGEIIKAAHLIQDVRSLIFKDDR